ncbi:MAG: WG repeat-containing protein [Muribaculaceae bacterium]|nr:WG repeat-containing protein [Muribaculaceae bacterium]
MIGRKFIGSFGAVFFFLLSVVFPTVAQTPYITPGTLYLDANSSLLDNVGDSVFWVMRGDPFRSPKYEFWKVDGTRLSGADWEAVFSGHPVFDSGVVAMRRPSENIMRKGNVCLLYTDGRVKDLNVKWDRVSNFKDGVAVVVPSASSAEAFYIDTTGKRIYPNVKVDGTGFNIIRPLRDGMRAYKAYGGGWGFIDGSGVVKLSPKYQEAGNFSEGHVWVKMSDGSQHLIDKTGKSVFQTSDGTARVSEVVDGRFYVEDGPNTCYYDLAGNRLGCFKAGNCFYGGYAFVSQPEAFLDIDTELIDTDMKVVRKIDWKVVDESVVTENGPVFSGYGLAAVSTMNGSYILKPNGDVVLRDYEDYNCNGIKGVSINHFKPVSDCGYLVADIRIEDDAWKHTTGKAILRPDGEVVMIVSEDKSFCRTYDRDYPVLQPVLDANGGSFTIKAVDVNQPPLSKKKTPR